MWNLIRDLSSRYITAVIPAFNEEKTIGDIVRKTRNYAREVIVVDDGSIDRTALVAEDAGAKVLRHHGNLGYGAALATGFQWVRNNGARVMVVLDGDGQHNPNEIPRLIQPIVDGEADIVTGSRFMADCVAQDIPGYRRFGIGVVNRLWALTSGTKMSDTQCGFRAYSRDAVEKIEITEMNMSASLEILNEAADNELSVKEVPVSVEYGINTSKLKPSEHGMELASYLLNKVKKEHPLLIFGGIGMFFVIFGLLFGTLALNSYFESRYLPFGPTIIATVTVYLGTLMIFGGLILNAIENLAARLEDSNKE